MTTGTSRTPPATVTQRKQQLIAEGAALRANIGAATQQVKTGMRADAMIKNVVAYAARTAAGLAGSGGGVAGIGLQTVLPVVARGVSALAKRPWFKPVLRGALLLGVAGLAAKFMIARKNARSATDSDTADQTDQ